MGERNVQEQLKFQQALYCGGLSANAGKAYNEFVQAIETEDGMTAKIQKIFRIIDEIVLGKEKDQFQDQLDKGQNLYRARIIGLLDLNNSGKGFKYSDGKFLGYNENNSREPLIGNSSAGRNNIPGESYLYVASNPQTACVEVKPQIEDLISLATFELVQPLKIINFASDKNFQREDTEIYNLSLGVLFTLLMFRYMQPAREENTYRVTQVISDYLRKTGIDGIAYKSFLSPGGINYTIFNCHKHKIKFCDSKIVLYRQAQRSFWDLSEKCAFLSNEEGKMMEWNDNDAEKIIKDLRARMKKGGTPSHSI